MQELVKNAIANMKTEDIGVRKNKEVSFLPTGRNICFNYFSQDYEWDEANKECKLKINVKTVMQEL